MLRFRLSSKKLICSFFTWPVISIRSEPKLFAAFSAIKLLARSVVGVHLYMLALGARGLDIGLDRIPERPPPLWRCRCRLSAEFPMNGLIYLVGLVVVVMAILSFFGLR